MGAQLTPPLIQLLERGVEFHQQGKFSQAKEVYEQALQMVPDCFDALYLLGTVLTQERNYSQAIEILSRALQINPNDVACCNNLGVAFKSLARFDDALSIFDQAIGIKPDHADSHNNRGNVLKELARMDEALASYDQAITIKPNYAQAHNNRGLTLHALDRLDEALASYDQAIANQPDYAEAYSNRGISLQVLGQLNLALASYDQAIALKPDYAQAYSNRGLILHELSCFDESLASYQQAIAIEPNYAEAYNNWGFTLNTLRHLNEALACYDQAIAINPNYAEALSNRGDTLQELGCFKDALASYDQAIAIKPLFVGAHWNSSSCHLLLGNFKQGWGGYEWRWKNKSLSLFKDQRDFSVPLWLGEQSLKGKTILLHAEQGLGDTLQFCRYADLVAQLGAKMILEVQPPLLNLLANLEGVHQIVVRGDPLPAFDYHCPLMSLPLAFKTDLHSIPAANHYIHSDPTKLAQWQTLLGPKTKPRIGLVWSSASAFKGDGKRSLALSELLQALPTEGFEYICLQKEIKESDQQTLRLNPQIQFFGDQLNDFTDTAALTNCVDLVLSTCTSVPHLAGALGKPTWVMIPYVPDWRWLLDRGDSPWYPSIKLFRQPSLGNWKSVFERVKADLIGMG